ncbi:hypothetical protein ACXDF8_00240 [Mycolicibacterium sp. CBM1]
MSRISNRGGSVGPRVRRRALPVVIWLRVGATAAGIGLALVAAPGAALADEGAAASHSTTTSHQGPAVGSTGRSAPAAARSAKKAPTARRVTLAAVPSTQRRAVAGTDSAATTSQASTAGAKDVVGQAHSRRAESAPASTVRAAATVAIPTPVAATACTACAMSSIGLGLQQFLTSTANWLAGFPANPVTDLLQGAVWLVRRTLFPASVGVVTNPIQIPLQLVDVCLDGQGSDGNCTGVTLQRLGIYVTLGSGNPIPQFFEFDTGAAGFLAAYASDDPTASPWWGSSGVTTGEPVTKSFDSGLAYEGTAATTTVAFYASQTSTTPLLSTGNVLVGQMDKITAVEGGKSTTVWTPDGAVDGTAPIDSTFYGDFGAAPSYEGNGITSLLNELTFARGVQPGYRVHVDPVTGQAWLQIGLTQADLRDPSGLFFSMVPDPAAPGSATAPNSNTRFYSPQLFDAVVNIVDTFGTNLLSAVPVGITPDTGADATLHNTNRSSQSDAIAYAGVTITSSDDANVGRLASGLDFSLTGTTTSGTSVTYFPFVTGTALAGGRVDVQNGVSDKDVYYFNAGISLFFAYDVVYNMGTAAGGGTLGLIPQLIQ